MKAHTSEFKEQIKTLGRELDSIVSFNNTELGGEQLNSVIPHYEGGLLKSVMKQLDIDSNVEINVGDVVNYKLCVKVNDKYEYLNFGNYIVNKVEKQEDFNSYMITCYDKMLYSMKDYEKLNISYPISVRDYITAICNHLGINFKNKNETFANYDKMIQNELYLDENDNSLGYTFRDVFDELAQATASTICINDNDELEIRYINDTQDTIDEEFLKDVNVNFGKKYGKVNSIVLSRSSGSDNVYLRDEASVSENGLTELKISDNQIMNWNDRSDYLPDILEKINGLEYYLNDFVSTGVCYYDLCDKYNVKIGDNIYPCIMLNDEINITQGLFEEVFTEELEISETDYKKSDKTDRKINQTNLIVDKQKGVIQGVVEQLQDIEVETTLTKEANGNPVVVTDAGPYKLESIKIEGKSYQETKTSRNKFYIDKSKLYTSTYNITLEKDGGISFNGTLGRNWFSLFTGYIVHTLPAGTYTFSITEPSDMEVVFRYRTQTSMGQSSTGNIDLAIPIGETSITFTVTEEILEYYALLQGGTKGNEINDIVYIQLEEGDKQTGFVPCGGIPSPDFPSEIKNVEGVTNLFNKDTVTLDYRLGNDGLPYAGIGYFLSDFISVEPNKTYYIGWQIKDVMNTVATYDKDKNFIQRYSSNSGYTITTGENEYYIRICRAKENLETTQIVEGSKGLPYVPYGTWLEVKSVGKNLLKFDTHQTKTPSSTWAEILVNGNPFKEIGMHLYYCEGEWGTKYKLWTLDGNGKIVHNLFSGQKLEITEEQLKNIVSVKIVVEGLTANTKYEGNIYPIIKKDDNDFTYEPYKENTALIDLNTYDEEGNITGYHSIKGNDTLKDGLYTQRRSKVILDGSEGWFFDTTKEKTQVFGMGQKLPMSGYQITSSHFVYNASGDAEKIASNGSDIYIAINKTTASTTEEFQNWLKAQYDAGTPVIVEYELATPIEHKLNYEVLEMHEGYNNITTNDELEPNMEIRYLTDSKLNAKYATKGELKIESDSIKQSVSGEISALDQKTEASLELKVDTVDYNDKKIISMINASADEINLKANRFSLESTNATITKEGVVDFVKGTIGNIEIGDDYLRIPISVKVEITQELIDEVLDKYNNGDTFTAEEIEMYDLNKDGKVNTSDIAFMRNAMQYNITPNNPGYLEILSNDFKSHIAVIDGNGKEQTKVSLTGITSNSISGDRISADELMVSGQDILSRLETNAMTLAFSAHTEIELTQTYTYSTLRFDTIESSYGSKLTYRNGEIVIGAGVKKVRVNANVMNTGPIGTHTFAISQNNVMMATIYPYHVNATAYDSASITSKILEVNEGDTIQLKIGANVTGTFKVGAKPYTWLTVEVVE